MILAIIQARMGSTRLPGKVLKPLLGKPMLAHQISRIKKCTKIDKLVIATSNLEQDNDIYKLAQSFNIPCYRGSQDNVLKRFYEASLVYSPTHIVRLTADCPVIDAKLIDDVIALHLSENNDYTANCEENKYTFPDGLDVEIFSFQALLSSYKNATNKSDLEHVTPYIIEHSDIFKLGILHQEENWSYMRLTVDNIEDFQLIEHIYKALYEKNNDFDRFDIKEFLDSHPELIKLNQNYKINYAFHTDQNKIKP
ncbi:hypothetical protein CJF42_22530 [Pseudoalteromonas sp. NBT06-2]|uniref:cytidylyltransferase domain-containing protein n=1 Tax=Pseudoalteromonas sp. NBT06-2 TaxID=2025950 RepID=UPI000BA5CE8C|nr:glycosyltransferase family protein [Pseudoalteromonas sp. NBT06-2]PAJ72200.1 hypothetical protein CJF42_22530 [Pseudoalteromonas sp. NBT06-2]